MSGVMGSRWRDRAACRSVDPEVFFPTAESGPVHEAQVAVAKTVCAGCPVRSQCLTEALARIPDGIAGGLTADERRTLRTARARRKSPAARPAVAANSVRSTAEVLEVGLRRGARAADVRAAGHVLLAAGRPLREVADRCGVCPRTVSRWAATATTAMAGSTGRSTATSTSLAVPAGAGKDRGGSRVLPLISHTNPWQGHERKDTDLR